jgi:hypothetical protein
MPARSRSEPPRFRALGEGVQHNPTIVSAEDGTAYVIARDAEGALLVAALSGSDRGRWTALGGGFAGPVAAHAGRREIEIFGVTPEGRAQGGTWRIGSSRRPEWKPLGRGLGKTPLRHVDVLVERAGIQLLAMTEDRRLLTLARGREAWNGTWKDHGSLDTFGAAPPPKPAVTSKAAKKANGSARPMPRRRGRGESRPST